MKALEIKNLTKIYDNNLIALDDISFEVEKGDFYALLGPNGAGKSTMIGIISSLVNKSSGLVKILGLDIDTHHSEAKKKIGIVGQESILFNGTIRDNILLGKKINDDKVYEALKTANAIDFINEFSNKLDHKIADNGANLSGGQKQRISIARAIISKSPILILDEATSSLDSKSEKLVQEALKKLMHNKTSIVIAHRLSTVKNAQNIVVLDKGKVIEQGTHDDLIKKKGVYNNLISLQSLS